MTAAVPCSEGLSVVLEDVAHAIGALDREPLMRAVALLEEAYSARKTVVSIGNGGSAATATHFAADLAKFATWPRPGFRSLDLVSNVPALSAWTNDEGWASAYEATLRAWLEPGDVVVAFSVNGGAGASANLVRAFAVARQLGALTIAVAADIGGPLLAAADCSIALPCSAAALTPVTEAMHVVVHHAICNELRHRIAGER